jgi:hypothetical protein
MGLNLLLSFVATVIMFTFSAIVLYRFVQRRQLHNLFWGIGLLMFGIGTFAEAYLALAWSDLLFRSWYVFGAMLNAGWLGHGSLTLLARRPWLRYLTLALVVLSLIGLVAVFTQSINSAAFTTTQPVSAQYKDILPKGGVRLLTPLFNVYGTIFLIGGAVYSAYLLWRKQTSPNRMFGNVLAAAGALVIASAGTLTRLFFGGFLTVSELAAAVLMFAGFMLASAPVTAPARDAEQVTHAA